MALLGKDKKVLVIDDQAGMRNQLQQTLTHVGFEKLHVVPSIQFALERMKEMQYDIILCDYYLGDSTNGQQFLEYLRTRDIIKRNTIFVMITAESNYEKVVVASECAPDDYLLKPFTAEMLINRLERLVARQDAFAVLDKAYDARDWKRVIIECDRMLANKDKHFIELCKVKAAALLKLERAEDAAGLYEDVLALRPLPWARLGLARARAALGDTESARRMAQELLTDSPQFLAAYDFLANLLAVTGNKNHALDVLQQARAVSPGTMSRIREIGSLAVDTGKHELAEEVMTAALQQHQYSPVREAADYAVLSRALSEQGKPEKALEVLKDARTSFKSAQDEALLAANESLAYKKAGNDAAAKSALEKALAADVGSLPPAATASLADACFALGQEGKAQELLKQLVQNHVDDAQVQGRVKQVFAAAGKDEAEAGAMIEQSTREVIQINNEGVRKAEAGQLDEAIRMLRDAADRLPNNLQIVSNAALALAMDIRRNGSTAEKLQACLRYRQLVASRNPGYPRLAQIDTLLKTAAQP